MTTDLHPDETDRLVAAMRGELTSAQVARRLAREVVSLYYDSAAAERVDQLPASSSR